MEAIAASNGPLFVRKRDGKTEQQFDIKKIEKAITAAWKAVGADIDEGLISRIANYVKNGLSGEVVDIETIQDLVEFGLFRFGKKRIAEEYAKYRLVRAAQRDQRLEPDQNAISDYIHPSKYSRYLPELGRRELYEETVLRNQVMHTKKFPQLRKEIEWAYDFVRDKRVFPSMRSMQFAGEAIEKVNNRIYNCSFTLIDRPEVFKEVLYLLLCGCGVGFSVQIQHVEKLPKLAMMNDLDALEVVHHTIGDSIEGWADALGELINSHIKGYYVEFNYSKIRPAGAPLKTSGGKAPGHLWLKVALEEIRKILTNASGRRLNPIEAYDILCLAADAVLSGGIRRSAMIAIFSIDDLEMRNAKATKDWHDKYPWRENSNNSVALLRGEVSERQFKSIFAATKQWGEPGFIFLSNLDHGANPCVEIGLNPVLEVTEANVEKLRARGVDCQIGDRRTGFAFCNLCELNAAKFKSFEDFKSAAEAAAIIGTLQASYTDMPYIGAVSEEIAKRDALLGIGMTGMLDAPSIACNPEWQRQVALHVIEVNKKFADIIGINQAARVTCVKPSGTTSLIAGGVGSGHHAHHARRYIRRVTANQLEPVFQYFKSINPTMCVRKPNGDWVIEFPVAAPPNALVKDDLTAIQFLEMVKSTQVNWVLPGTARNDDVGLHHNVSNTVQVKENEWDVVADYIWENQQYFTAISLVPDFSDKAYPFAPNERIVTEDDERRWNQIISSYKPVDYSLMVETEDGTNLKGEQACANGSCLAG